MVPKLGAALLNSKKGAVVFILIGAAIGPSLKAQYNAKQLSIPVLY